MINKGKLAAHALALFEIGQKEKILPLFYQELTFINQFLNKSYIEYLGSHFLSLEERYEQFKKIFSNVLNPKIVNFIRVLIKHQIIQHWAVVYSEFQKRYFIHEQIYAGTVQSVIPLTSVMLKKLEKIYSNKFKGKVFFVNEINPHLIGGVRLIIGERIIDFSIKSQLQRLRNELIEI